MNFTAKKQLTRNPVRVLSAEVARKIAAGEVIDRPNAIIRELMDNAVDSGADSITVELEDGGITKIRVSDNGWGMTKEDLNSCARPHATSKISEAADLMNLSTLGFRGEALASIAAVSRLTISSGNFRMRASITENHIIEEIPLIQNGRGTIVMSEGLFENFPARRVFLKRPASENLMCRETFVEKALPRPDIAFRLTVDGQIRLDLPKAENLTERFIRALELKEPAELFTQITREANDWSFSLIIGEPSVYKNDRKQIFIYVNGRKVQEYSLVQAIEYGCQGFFPNGTHPVAALFVQINPALVDFNIHPAKKEVRFKDSSELHHGVSSSVREHFFSYGIKPSSFNTEQNEEKTQLEPEFNFETKNKNIKIAENGGLRAKFFQYESSSRPQIQNLATQALRENPTEVFFNGSNNFSTENLNSSNAAFDDTKAPQFTTADSDGFCFIGTVLNCFLVAQVNQSIYFIDQHAAHERILFDKLISSPPEKQPLLVPYTITTSTDDEEKFLDKSLKALSDAGFDGKNTGNGKFEFSSVPVRWKGNEKDLADSILSKKEEPEKLIYAVAAMTACKAAIKDGNILDRDAAEALAKKALALSDPHCPHGRPVWTELTKEHLFARVRRTR